MPFWISRRENIKATFEAEVSELKTSCIGGVYCLISSLWRVPKIPEIHFTLHLSFNGSSKNTSSLFLLMFDAYLEFLLILKLAPNSRDSPHQVLASRSIIRKLCCRSGGKLDSLSDAMLFRELFNAAKWPFISQWSSTISMVALL